MMRLDRFLANQGFGTRKEVKKLIRGAAVRVNGEIILKDGAQIDEEKDEVSVNGEQVWYQRFFYLMLNKPQGVVCANDDERHETVFDLLPDLGGNRARQKSRSRCGRKDKDSLHRSVSLAVRSSHGPLRRSRRRQGRTRRLRSGRWPGPGTYRPAARKCHPEG